MYQLNQIVTGLFLEFYNSYACDKAKIQIAQMFARRRGFMK